jgi:uncharacterized membrane protein
MKSRSFVLASAAAALFLAGAVHSANADEGKEAAKIHCDGVNQCKGQSDCATATNQCKGQNSCKGKGFLSMTEAECETAKAESK